MGVNEEISMKTRTLIVFLILESREETLRSKTLSKITISIQLQLTQIINHAILSSVILITIKGWLDHSHSPFVLLVYPVNGGGETERQRAQTIADAITITRPHNTISPPR